MEIDFNKFAKSEKHYLQIDQIFFYHVLEKETEQKVNQYFIMIYTLALHNGKLDENYIQRHSLVSDRCKGILQLEGYKSMTSSDQFNFKTERYALLYEEITHSLITLRSQSQQYVLEFLHQLIYILADLQEAKISFSYLSPYDIVFTKKKEFKILNIENAFNLIGDEQDTMNRTIGLQGLPYMDSYTQQAAFNKSIAIPQNFYKSSIYSIALIALEFHSREFPIKQVPPDDIKNLIKEFGLEYGQFMQKLLENDRKNRYDCIEARNNLPAQTIMFPIHNHPIQEENYSTLRLQQDEDCIPLFQEEISKEIIDLIYQYKKTKIKIIDEDDKQPPPITLINKTLLNIISDLNLIPFIEAEQITNQICIDETEQIFHCKIRGQNQTVIIIDNIPNIFILQMLVNYQKLLQLKIPGICSFKAYSIKQQADKNLLCCSRLYLIIKQIKGTLNKLKYFKIEPYRIVHQIAETLSQLNQHYIYGELTSSRVLLTEENETFIAMYSYTNLNKQSIRPPEKINQNQYQSNSDVWSLGLIIYEIITKETLTFSQIQKWKMFDQVSKNSLLCGKIKSQKLKQLLQQMTEYDNNKRRSIDMVIQEIDILKIFSTYDGYGFSVCLNYALQNKDTIIRQKSKSQARSKSQQNYYKL